MIKRSFKLSLLVLILLSFTQETRSAYDPILADGIKVTNTLAADVNTVAVTQFNNLNTTAVINTNTDVFTSVDSNGVNCVAGTYMVDITLYRTHNSAGNNDRATIALEVTVDGVSTGLRGADGYIRSPIDGSPGGHEESSTSVSDLVRLNTAGKIGFTTQGLAIIIANPAPAAQSILRIVRISD